MTYSNPRILLYSHDTYGLGHLRRSLSVAGQIAADIPGAHQLIITGSMVAGAFGLPPRTDIVKLPALSKRSSGRYKARALPLSLRRTLAWREQMILQAVVNFKPHLVLVDKAAAGVHGELLPTFRHLKTWSPQTKIVLGMRDIEDSPAATQAEWSADGISELLENVYDRILLYGQRTVFDPLMAYQVSPAIAPKVVECGYLWRGRAAREPETVRRELDIGDKPLILVTVGGGGDGYDIIKAHLEMVSQQGEVAVYHTVAITGPLMPQGKRNALLRAARNLPVTVLQFTPELTSYMAAADLVIAMAGYNTVCEVLSLKKRALLIPRVRIRAEQRLRAQSLAQCGLVRVLLPEDLTPARLAAEIKATLSAPPPPAKLNLDGLSNASAAIAELLESPAPIHPNELFRQNGSYRKEMVTI